MDRWLAIDRDDLTSEVQIPVSIPDGEANAGFLFKQGIFNKLKDDHLFWSVFSRPVRSRCSCVLATFTFSSMCVITFSAHEQPLIGLRELKECVSAWRLSTWRCSLMPCGKMKHKHPTTNEKSNWQVRPDEGLPHRPLLQPDPDAQLLVAGKSPVSCWVNLLSCRRSALASCRA